MVRGGLWRGLTRKSQALLALYFCISICFWRWTGISWRSLRSVRMDRRCGLWRGLDGRT